MDRVALDDLDASDDALLGLELLGRVALEGLGYETQLALLSGTDLLVGMEGVYGTVLPTALVLPVAYFIPGKDAGSLENTLDSLDLIKSSTSIQVVIEL